MDWNLTLLDTSGNRHSISFQQLEKWKGENIPVEEYVPRKQAEAVFFHRLIEELGIRLSYSQVKFIAQDGFSQRIDASDLNEAFLVFKHKGEPLQKGFPVRLYVPGNGSDCLNVKSIVEMELKKD